MRYNTLAGTRRVVGPMSPPPVSRSPWDPDNGDTGTGPPQRRKADACMRTDHQDERTRELAIFLIDLPANDMERRLTDALRVYVNAMRYPAGTENQRAAMWLEHIRRPGWQAAAAVEADAARDGSAPSTAELSDAPLLGVAYGYPGAAGQWWQQQVVLGLQRAGLPAQEIAQLMDSYFELTELHIHPRAQGHGVGEALARRLLAGRCESNVLLSTPETNGEANRAWRLYRRLGFTDVIRRYHFAGDPRPFAILGRKLPL
jgi:ribosomal protein S18 acetylase RimI-like enzyme